MELIHGESNSGPLGYGHDIISNRLCAHCQKLEPAHQLTIFDSHIVIDIVNLVYIFQHPDRISTEDFAEVERFAGHRLLFQNKSSQVPVTGDGKEWRMCGSRCGPSCLKLQKLVVYLCTVVARRGAVDCASAIGQT